MYGGAVVSVTTPKSGGRSARRRLIPHGLIASAGQGFDNFEIDDLDDASGTNDSTHRLYCVCYLGYRRASNPEHLSQKFVRESDRVALGSVTGFQQPPAEPRLEPMHSITRRGDPRLCEQTRVTA